MPTIHDLPIEIIVMIFEALREICDEESELDKPCNLLQARQVCGTWKSAVEERFRFHYALGGGRPGNCQLRVLRQLLQRTMDDVVSRLAEVIEPIIARHRNLQAMLVPVGQYSAGGGHENSRET